MCAALVRALGADVLAGSAAHRVHGRCSSGCRGARGDPRRRGGPARARRSGDGEVPAMTSLDDLPLRDELRGMSPYGAPQLEVPVRLNTNENSYPVPEDVAAAMEKALAAQVRDLNRYPDRDSVALRTDLAAYLGSSAGRRLTAANLWAANGSNEIQQQLL